MIGIYQDSFVDYLKDNLGYVKQTSKNLIIPCPWCEYQEDKDHYHMYISLEAPIFHCFHASCERGGILKTLIKKISGVDTSEKFIDKDKLNEFKNKREVFIDTEKAIKKIILPPLRKESFKYKEMYLRKRLKFSNIPSENITGLIYDVDEFIKINQIPVGETLFRLQDYLQNNFIGFLTEHNSTVIFRNVDDFQSMRFFKLKIQPTFLLDYYKIPGGNPNSNTIVLAEGIFDIFVESIFDNLNIKNDVRFYASALSSKYLSLIHSIVFNEMVFMPDIVILSDRGIPREYYNKMKKYNRHVVNRLKVYYNKTGKDFAESPVNPSMVVINNDR